MPSSTWASACSALIFCFALFYYIYFVLCHLQVQGEWQLTVGSQGDQPGQFNSPVGLALSPDDAFLLVADSSNQRVAVLRATDGAWVRALTGPPGTLECPWYVVVVPSTGEVLVSDINLNQVVRFRSIDDDTVAGWSRQQSHTIESPHWFGSAGMFFSCFIVVLLTFVFYNPTSCFNV